MRVRHILGELRRIVSDAAAAMRALAARSPDKDAILDEAISNLPHGIVVFDKDRRVISCNARYRDIYRLPPDRVQPGTPVSDLIRHRLTLGLVTPVDPEEYIRDRMSKPVAASDAINEYTDGRTIAYFIRPMSGGGGIAVHEDITERRMLQQRLEEQHALARKQEEELRVRNLQFDLAINNMSQGLCFFDGSQRLIVCNKRYTQIYNLDPARVLPGTTLQQIVDLRYEAGTFPDMTPAEYLVWRSNIAVSAQASDTIVRLKNGRIIRIHHQPMPDLGWVATHEDITDHVRIEEHLEEQNRRFDAALNNMPHGLSMFDSDQRLIVCNRRYQEMYRLPASLTVAGAELKAIMDYRAATGQSPLDSEIFHQEQLLRSGSGSACSYKIALHDGRHVQIDYEPMPSGGWVTTHQDITEATHAEARIAHLARHDSLTNLPNRFQFRDALDHALTTIDSGKKIALISIDLDQFKAVNDTLGHPAGDELLKAVSGRLRNCVRSSDTVARLGGDEFAVIRSKAAGRQGLASLATRIIDSLSEPFHIGGEEVTIGTSVGIAIAPDHGKDFDTLLKSADMALYRAKSDGRGVHRFFEQAMDAKIREQRALEAELSKALTNDEFEVFYQPLVNIAAREVIGFEALLRWRSPARGLVLPNVFIPVLEEIGLINEVGSWVLKRACADAVGWPSRAKIAVNLSPVQFKGNRLGLDVCSALASSGLPAQRLELEITETAMLQDVATTLAMLRELKSLGLSISLDDFGTGYSSLSYLQKFPFDKIKIDQTFVRELPKKDESLAIVRAIIRLADSLGMTTLAEGVETQQQFAILRREGCVEAQGYLFSRPVTADQVAQLHESVRSLFVAA
jgi:diguanylate cyclase (GGDEF)-like protein